jgi:diacylglycerol kinase (ATP)
MSRDIFVIVNPAAGGGRAPRYKAGVSDFFISRARSVEFTESTSTEDVREHAARAAADGYPYVLALGGDGTFHHLVEGIRGTNAVAGFLPAGGGNDIARALDIPADPIRAADAFLHSASREIDLIRVRFADGRLAHCLGAAGMGLDAEAAYLAGTRFSRWPGAMRYVAGALWTYFRGAAFSLRAKVDGDEWSGSALFAVVANAGQYGSGVRIAPAAKMDDGWLELVLIRDLAWTRLVEAIPIVLTSGDIRFPEVERFRCKRVLLEASRRVRVHGDGELLGGSPAEFEILPRAIRVMVPKRREAQ